MLSTMKSFKAGEIFAGLCLSTGLATLLYQNRRKKSLEHPKGLKESLEDYSYRELFHLFINPEEHYDQMYLAKEFSDQMHQEASEYMLIDHEDSDDFADHFTYFEYSKEKFNERMDYIFNRLFQERYLDWCEQGQPVGEESRYWWAQTKLHLLEHLIQREPYHLTDGIWLRGVHQGPMSTIQSKLFSIYIDEMGNGDISQNHCNVYLDVLNSLGVEVPPIISKEFANQQSIFDISFKKPVLTLTTSLFPYHYEPEILGYTLWLETTSPSEHAPLRKILDRYDLNPKFSLLHTAIDNNVNGHGKYARDAVIDYLDRIEKTEGKEAVQAYWKRIWIGYVAYATTGNEMNDALKDYFRKQKARTPREDFLDLIREKAPYACKMHGSRRVGPHKHLLNDLFASGDPEKVCSELENSRWIVKGNPGKSPLLNHAISFHGPMYQIFNHDELIIICRWILALAPSAINDIISLLLKKRALLHLIPNDIRLKLPSGEEKLLRDLFLGKPNDLLKAFRASEWTIPFNGSKLTKENVHTSQLIKSIQPNGSLEKIFNCENEEKDVLENWLLDGAPLLDETNHFQIKSHENFQFEY